MARTGKGPVVGIAGWSARHPWKALLVWLVLVVVCVVAGKITGQVQLSEGGGGNGDSARASQIVDEAKLNNAAATETALIQRRDGRALADGDVTRVRTQLSERLGKVPAAGPVGEPTRSADGRAALVGWEIRGKTDDASDKVAPMLAATKAVAQANPELTVKQVGDGSINEALSKALDADFQRAEILSIPITLIILIVAFGALIAAVIPVALALMCVATALGLAAVTSQVFAVSDALASVVLLVGMAVGVDYSLFYLRRARDERARGASRIDAADIAAQTAGRAVAVSGITVIIAMSGMFLSGNKLFGSFAVGTILVVAAAVVGSITVLPALAGRFGDKLDRPRVPFLHRFRKDDGTSRIWSAILAPVLRHPKAAFALSAGALAALTIPAFGMNTRLPGTADLPRSVPIMRDYDALTAAFPSEGSAHVVVVKAKDVTTPTVSSAISALVDRTRGDKRFAVRERDVRTSKDRTAAIINIPYAGDSEAATAEQGLSALRQTIVPQTVGAVAEAKVAGPTADSRDFNDQLAKRLPYVLAFVLTLTFVVMLFTFRSTAIALTTVGLNMLSVGAAYGLLVVVFQNRWAEGLLGFTSNGAIVSWLPLFLFVILFGLSMDYHVFVVSRIREAVQSGMSTRDAIASGISSSAGVVTSAAVVMVAVFGIFATLTTLDFKQMGIGLAGAILIDATIVRGVLLPSAMAIVGEANWRTPKWLAKFPTLDHSVLKPSEP